MNHLDASLWHQKPEEATKPSLSVGKSGSFFLRGAPSTEWLTHDHYGD